MNVLYRCPKHTGGALLIFQTIIAVLRVLRHALKRIWTRSSPLRCRQQSLPKRWYPIQHHMTSQSRRPLDSKFHHRENLKSRNQELVLPSKSVGLYLSIVFIRCVYNGPTFCTQCVCNQQLLKDQITYLLTYLLTYSMVQDII
jgi:hypothetical protein